jgi:hypothetical protein
VRLWGTVGWVIPGLLLGYWFTDPKWLCWIVMLFSPARCSSELADAFRLGALVSFALGLYALALPETPPHRPVGTWLAGLAALQLLRQRRFAIYCASALVLSVTLPFGQQGIPLLLEELGVPRPWLSPAMTIAQSTEIGTLALLPMFLLRLGIRGTMRLGLLAWTLALSVMAVGWPLGLVIAVLGCNGLCICCFQVAGQVFVNSKAQGDFRASAQALLTFVNGIGLLLGNLLVAEVRRQTEGALPATFGVGAGLAVFLLGFFFVGFNDDQKPPP